MLWTEAARCALRCCVQLMPILGTDRAEMGFEKVSLSKVGVAQIHGVKIGCNESRAAEIYLPHRSKRTLGPLDMQTLLGLHMRPRSAKGGGGGVDAIC